MIKRLRKSPSIIYGTIALAIAILFFMFYSFGIDNDAVVEGYKSSIYTVNREAAVETIQQQVTSIQNNEANLYGAVNGVQPSQLIDKKYGGWEIPLYYQYDSRWGGIKFGGGNIASSGCGPTSLAMVITYLTGKPVYPNDIVAYIGNKYYVQGAGQSHTMLGETAPHWKCRAEYHASINAEGIVKALKDGHPVIVTSSGYGTSQEFTKGGHYMVLRGITDDGKILVNDPNDKESKKHYAKEYDPDFIVKECSANGAPKPYWICYGPKD